MVNPKEILDKWLTAVNNGDVEVLLGLYNPNAVLIPTFTNRILNTPEKIREYFVSLKNRQGLHVSLHEKTVKVQQVSESISAVSGIYLWQFYVEEELLSFEARFSFVFDIILSNPIMHHHSSQIPRTL